ncbi:MAG: MoxR family ATPase [Deltaproteobacteria bacterium]|nr:MoxR family ATPase [Deltaproteobacteria bacterium]
MSSSAPAPAPAEPGSRAASAQAPAVALRLLEGLEKVIRGKREQLELLLGCVAAGGHALLEDIPGTGKTTLAKALALLSGCAFKRIQFTPDLLPSDILGTAVFNPREGTFSFKPGPIFANVVIADEINRASPRTQSALLEALSEQQVTVDGQTHPLVSPFLCIATQNPIEFHGTYPLPEAQLDRFALQLSLGYAPEAEERAILAAHRHGSPLQGLSPVATAEDLASLQKAVESVVVEDSIADYALRIVHATREHPSVRLGVSMRGALHLARMAQARALLKGRDYVLPEDLKALAVPVLAHRLVLDTRAKYAGTDRRELMTELAGTVPLPR